jgi:hypothetical protein
MNATLKNGKYNDGSTKVQYARHGVKGQSYAGFYMFLVALVGAGGWALSVIISH